MIRFCLVFIRVTSACLIFLFFAGNVFTQSQRTINKGSSKSSSPYSNRTNNSEPTSLAAPGTNAHSTHTDKPLDPIDFKQQKKRPIVAGEGCKANFLPKKLCISLDTQTCNAIGGVMTPAKLGDKVICDIICDSNEDKSNHKANVCSSKIRKDLQTRLKQAEAEEIRRLRKKLLEK